MLENEHKQTNEGSREGGGTVCLHPSGVGMMQVISRYSVGNFTCVGKYMKTKRMTSEKNFLPIYLRPSPMKNTNSEKGKIIARWPFSNQMHAIAGT